MQIFQISGYNFESLNRHGVTVGMIDEVLIGSMVSRFLIEDARFVEDTCEMIVGYTLSDRLLEIGVRYEDEETFFVFHAQTVSPGYRERFEEEWG